MRYWYWFIQTFLWPPAWILIRLFYRVQIRGREHLSNLQTPVIIASNHKTLFDVFLIGTSLPFASRFFPLRFMTEEIRFRGPVLEFLRKLLVLQFIYRLTGGFPSRRGEGVEKAISHPLKLLAGGQTVLMFPEGGLIREDVLGVFYPGTAVLAAKSGVFVLPLSMRFSGRQFSLSFGAPFKLKADSVEAGTQLLREKISKLLYN